MFSRSLSSWDFLRTGVRSASFMAVGIEAVLRERLIMVVSTPSKAGWQVLNRDARMELRLQDLMGNS